VLALLSLAAIGLYVLLSPDSDTGGSPGSAGDAGDAIGAPGEPYPYTTPVPPRTPTPADGTYDRRLSVARAGGRPVKCARCAPYRIEAGAATLVLDRGWFRVEHPAAGFRSLGHFFVRGDRLVFFNDPNCPTTRGVYEWSMAGTQLRLALVRDPCPFDRLRGRYLTAEPWTGA
jgi:hypothetical protein